MQCGLEQTSQSMLDAVVAGDEARWTKLLELYRPLVVRELRRVLHRFNAADADDIAQDVFVVLFLRLGSFRRQGPGAFRAFLREITRRQALAWVKRRRPGQLPEGMIEGELLAGLNQWADPESSLSQRWEQEHAEYWRDRILQEARQRCQASPKQARSFSVYHAVVCEQRNIAEVAAESQISLATAYRALHEGQGCINAIRLEWADLLE